MKGGSMKLKDLILDNLEVPISRFSKEIGLTRRTIYYILNEKHQPRMATIKKICKYFKVNFRDYI